MNFGSTSTSSSESESFCPKSHRTMSPFTGDSHSGFGKKKKEVVREASSSSKESEDDQSPSDLSTSSSPVSGSSCDDINKASRKQKTFAKKSLQRDKKREKEHRKKHEKNQISMDDFLSKQSEFKMWLFEEKCKCMNEMSSPKLKSHFKTFVKLWNKKKLPQKYYRGSEESVESPAPATSALTFSFSEDFDKSERVSFRRPKSKRLSIENSNVLESPFATFGKTPPKVLTNTRNGKDFLQSTPGRPVLSMVNEETTPECNHDNAKSESATTLVLGEYQIPKRIISASDIKEDKENETKRKVAPYLITTYPWASDSDDENKIENKLETKEKISDKEEESEVDVNSPVYAVPVKEKKKALGKKNVEVQHVPVNIICSPPPPPVPPPPAPEMLYDSSALSDPGYKAVEPMEMSPPLPPMPVVDEGQVDIDSELPPPPSVDDLIYSDVDGDIQLKGDLPASQNFENITTWCKSEFQNYKLGQRDPVSLQSHYSDLNIVDPKSTSSESESPEHFFDARKKISSVKGESVQFKVTDVKSMLELPRDSISSCKQFSSFGYHGNQSPALARKDHIGGIKASQKKGFACSQDILSLYTKQERMYEELPECSIPQEVLDVDKKVVAKTVLRSFQTKQERIYDEVSEEIISHGNSNSMRQTQPLQKPLHSKYERIYDEVPDCCSSKNDRGSYQKERIYDEVPDCGISHGNGSGNFCQTVGKTFNQKSLQNFRNKQDEKIYDEVPGNDSSNDVKEPSQKSNAEPRQMLSQTYTGLRTENVDGCHGNRLSENVVEAHDKKKDMIIDKAMLDCADSEDFRNSSLELEKYIIPTNLKNKSQLKSEELVQNVPQKRKHLSGEVTDSSNSEEETNASRKTNTDRIELSSQSTSVIGNRGILKSRHKSCDELSQNDQTKRMFVKQKSLDDLDSEKSKYKKIKRNKQLSIFDGEAVRKNRLYLETDIDTLASKQGDNSPTDTERGYGQLSRSKSMETIIW